MYAYLSFIHFIKIINLKKGVFYETNFIIRNTFGVYE
jgi:hypothetical protein